jgi:hypothetical protein
MHRRMAMTLLVLVFLVLSGASTLAASPQAVDPPAAQRPQDDRSSESPASHHFHWAPDSPQHAEVGVNFGLLQLALGGFNVAGEVRRHRLWLEYSHGMDLTLNNFGNYSLTQTEKTQNLHIHVPYTTGAGVGFTLIDQLWLGVEVKAHRFDVNAPGGPVSSYETYSVGPVLGYKLSIFKGLYANAYLRYWPNVATSLNGDQIALQETNGTVIHSAHDWSVFANVAIGYAFRH